MLYWHFSMPQFVSDASCWAQTNERTWTGRGVALQLGMAGQLAGWRSATNGQ